MRRFVQKGGSFQSDVHDDWFTCSGHDLLDGQSARLIEIDDHLYASPGPCCRREKRAVRRRSDADRVQARSCGRPSLIARTASASKPIARL